jgi:hypothetical protein
MSEPAGPAEPGDEVQVLSGVAPGGLSWVVVCENGKNDELYTFLRVYSGNELLVAGSGFGGPKLYPGQIMQEWRGRTDDLPYFVMARTRSDVERVVAITDLGVEVELTLSEPVERYGLRFAAAGLPAGHMPMQLRVEAGGTVLETLPQPIPPFRPR